MFNAYSNSTIMLKAISVCSIVVIGFFAFSDFSFAVKVSPPCLSQPSRLDPYSCVECESENDKTCGDKKNGTKPICNEHTLTSGDQYFLCAPSLKPQYGQVPIIF